MSAEEPTASAGVRFTVYDPFAEALYCRCTFNEAAAVADHLGCSLIIQSRYGNGQMLSPEGVICRYRRNGELWHVERSPTQPKPPGP